MRSGAPTFTLAALLLGLLASAAVYYPGLLGDFVFDDWPNIILNERLQVDDLSIDAARSAALSAEPGALKRPVSMLTFWANYYATGLDPFYFKLTNLAIHLLNGVGLFWLARLLLQSLAARNVALTPRARDAIALGAALVWLLHPLNVTSVLYVVQRMTSLSATFQILGVVTYLLGRRRIERGETGFPLILGGFAVFGSLAVLAKENGVLLPLYIAAIELGLLRFAGVAQSARRKLQAFVVVTAALPLIAAALFLVLNPEWLLQQYQQRPFTLTERILTEARVLWLYVVWLVAPTRASLGLFHDDVLTSHGLLDPPTTLAALVGIVAVAAAAVRLRNRAPLFTFAVLWFVAGHVLESTVIGLELVHEHRNYLPIFGPLLAAAYGLWRVAAHMPAAARYAIPGIFLVAYSSVTLARALDWSTLQTLQLASARDHPNSPRSNHEAGTALGNLALREPQLAPQVYDDAKRYLERAAELDGASTTSMFGMILLDATVKRPADEAGLDRLATRLRTVPLRPTVIEQFRSLIDWSTRGLVALPEPAVSRLFESALDNPTIDRATRAALLSQLSSYHFGLGNQQDAVSLAIAAVEEDPAHPVHHISLAKLSILLGNFELASRELEAARRADTLRRFDREVQAVALALEKADSEPGAAATDLALR
jgi:tetratricopeptide (TPR) repeat protein